AVFGRERLAAVRAFSIDECALILTPAVRVERRVAVRAQDPEVLEAIVVPDAVGVVEDKRHPLPSPLLALATELALSLLDALGEEASLEAAALIGRTLDEDLGERQGLAPRRASPAPVEVIGRDAP